MGQPKPKIPEDELHGLLRKAVKQVRRDSGSRDLVERCAARATEIPGSATFRPTDGDLGRRVSPEVRNAWRWPATVCLAASLLIALSLNILQIALDRPDPHRQQVALLTTPNQQKYVIYSDLRLERVGSPSVPH